MPALSEWIRDELRAHIRDLSSFQPTDFVWKFTDVEFHPVAGPIANSTMTPQRKPLLTCTHREDTAVEFQVLAAQQANTHKFDLVCEYSPALMFTTATVEISDPAEIKTQMTEWLAVVSRQLSSEPSMSRRVDELVERIADKLKGLDEPYSEPRRDQLRTRLGQLASLTLVMREGADVVQKTSLTDAQKDARYLADHLAEVPRGRAMRWMVGTIARVDYAWQLASGADEPHDVLQDLWEAADFKGVLGEDYRTRARLARSPAR